MSSRYERLKQLKNSADLYQKTFVDRNVKFVNQYETPTFNYPTKDNLKNLDIIQHVWKDGDRFYKLAAKYYGDPRDWWIIALYNSLPTESHIKVGDVILIPTPLIQVLEYITY